MDQARISSIRSSKGVPGSGFASITAATNMLQAQIHTWYFNTPHLLYNIRCIQRIFWTLPLVLILFLFLCVVCTPSREKFV
jgi:hypothetical protein